MSKNTVDYEKQFLDDLERARELSLESLALEQFKNKKRIQDLNISLAANATKTTKSVSRASSMTETDSNRSDRLQVKSRPRPGAVSSAQTQSLIAPPPTAIRRNSSVAAPSEPSTPDLISFNSSPTNNKFIDICQQLYNLNNQVVPVRPTLPLQQQGMLVHQQPYQYPHGTPQFLPYSQVQTGNIGWNKNTIFGNANVVSTVAQQEPNVGLPSQPPAIGFTSGVLMPDSVSNTMFANSSPAIMPKSLTPTPTPAPSNPQLPPPAVPSTSSQPKATARRPSTNLIDLTPNAPDERNNSVRVSILEAFDPLTTRSGSEYDSLYRTISPECSVDDSVSVCDSVYEDFYPYEYIYSGSGSNSLSDPIYAAVVKSENAPTSPPPPLPSRQSTIDRKQKGDPWVKKTSRLHDSVKLIDKKKPSHNSDLKAFHLMVQNLRNEFKYDSPDTNMGLVVSPMMEYRYRHGTSIKLCVYPHFDGADRTKAVTFTCDVTTSIQHVTLQLTFDLEAPTSDQYTLKVWGYNEYLAPTTLLSQYEYVHNCIKLEEDVVLILIPDRLVDKSLRRTKQDDNCDREIRAEDIIPHEPTPPITYLNLKISLEHFEMEVDKIIAAATELEKSGSQSASLQPSGVIQSVKCVVRLLGSLETVEIMEAVDALRESCTNSTAEHLDTWNGRNLSDIVQSSCEKLREALKALIKMYSEAFRVDFEINDSDSEDRLSTSVVSDVMDSIIVRVCAVYRPSPEWNYDNYMIAAQIYHGMRPMGQPELTQPYEIKMSWYPNILFNHWLDMEVPISSLARESRLVLVLYGRTLLEVQETSDKEPMPQYRQEEIGWAAIQFFDYNNFLAQGNVLLSIWPKETSHMYGPAPSQGTYPFSDHPVLEIQLMGPSKTIFPPVSLPAKQTGGDFNSLDLQTQQQLVDIVEQDMLTRCPPQYRELLWDKRHYLYKIPKALPKVLLASLSWDWSRLGDLYGMLRSWSPLKPVEAFQLLLPTYPDMEVRKLAVKWIAPISSDELVDYLPQLVVALRHETHEDSPLARFLMERALKSPRVAHHLFWLLSHNLPGSMPQNYGFEKVERDSVNISEIRHHRRLVLMLRAILAICGEALRNCFIRQQFLVKELHEAAVTVQRTKEAQRMSNLATSLRNIHQILEEHPTSLPLSPTLRVCGVNVGACSYFPSNTLPLKISFMAKDGSTIPAIFKVGDELQQDMLTLQMIRLMDKLWLREGLDLKMVAYGCVPTGKKRGMIELVAKSDTLRKIQVEHGLTGSFKDKPIAEWLAKHNPSELEYSRAVENFTASCAGYCVVTYILGICDRHNDNIMLKTSGHLFHIDFGKFLGDAQMFGNFKRDRTPFVLTSDMAYVINGGDRPSEKFHKFVDLCCQAFNIVRSNGNLFLYLFTLMASSGLKGVTTEAVSNLHRAILPGASNAEAAAYFARLIESSLKSWFTQFNFFLHNLAQLKFNGDHGDGETLSFVPKTYNMETDGKLVRIEAVGYKKLYDPDKYYVYMLHIWRENQTEPMEILRTYKEFCELHQKLCLKFPMANLHSLSNGLHMGRSNVKQVAQKRLVDIKLFLPSLQKTADEIAHSDLVYTFFHPLLRDQQVPDHFSKKSKERRMEEKSEIGKLKGQLKLSIQFNRGVFSVMVHHVRGLPLVGNAQEPSTYVKVYLYPDPTKETKRKTKVVKRNCHPSFMERLEYRMPLDVIRCRTLTATVWNYDALQENEYLGGVELELQDFDLRNEITEWFTLTNVR